MVFGVTMVKDEADIIETTIEHMAHHCDALIVADNGSTDGTLECLRERAGYEWASLTTGGAPYVQLDTGSTVFTVRIDTELGYYQSDKISALAEEARQLGATWIVPFDADERWYTDTDGERVADFLSSLPDEAMICEAALLDHVATGDPEMPWRRKQQLPLRKVACRAVEGLSIGQGNHSAEFPDVPVPLCVTGKLEIRHFPYRSPEQFIRKARNGAAAYAATDLPEDVGAHWRQYGKLTDEQLREVFFKWFHSADPENDKTLVYAPARCLQKL